MAGAGSSADGVIYHGEGMHPVVLLHALSAASRVLSPQQGSMYFPRQLQRFWPPMAKAGNVQKRCQLTTARAILACFVCLTILNRLKLGRMVMNHVRDAKGAQEREASLRCGEKYCGGYPTRGVYHLKRLGVDVVGAQDCWGRFVRRESRC